MLAGCARPLPELPREINQPVLPTPAPVSTGPAVQRNNAATAAADTSGNTASNAAASVAASAAAAGAADEELGSEAGAVAGAIAGTVAGTAASNSSANNNANSNNPAPGRTLASSAQQIPSAPPRPTFEVLHKANYNPFDIDNGKNFRALQTLSIYRSELGRHSIESTKEVDFNTSQVLVSSAGEKPTGGYKIGATDLEELDDKVVVTVVQSVPGPGCETREGRSHPFEFIVVPSRKPIEIFERQIIEDC